VEDEPNLARIVSETLVNQGFEVRLVTDGAKVMQQISAFQPDICVVDIMLPNIDGYKLCMMIRKQLPAVPVIFVTAKTETADLVKGFEAGGTDYIRKPFSMEELIVRIRNQVSQSRRETLRTPAEWVIGNCRYLPGRYEIITPARTIKLSQRDQEVLTLLVQNLNNVTDRQQILLTVWGDNSFFNSRNLDVYIRKLRGYFMDDTSVEIVTLKTKGYMFLTKRSPGDQTGASH
jgi:DNA-binding response OmpR family regulator